MSTMAGVCKLKEISARRHSRQTKEDYFTYADDDSRPLSPDKQLKIHGSSRASAFTASDVRYLPSGLVLTGFLPKHYLKPQPCSSGGRKTSKAKTPTVITTFSNRSTGAPARSGAQNTAAQPRRTSSAACKAAGTALPRTHGLSSRVSSSSGIGAAGLQRKPTPAAIARLALPSVAAADVAPINTRAKCSRSNSMDWHSSSNSSSRASSRGATPAPGAIPSTLRQSKKQQQTRHSAAQHNTAQPSGPAGGVPGGRITAPHADDVPAVSHRASAPGDPAAAAAAAALETGAASVTELIKLQARQQQRWQQQQQQQHANPQPLQPAPNSLQQQQHVDSTRKTATAAAAVAACSSDEPLRASDEFEEVSRDVAARIIQAHWRWWRDNRADRQHQQTQQQVRQYQQQHADQQVGMPGQPEQQQQQQQQAQAEQEDACQFAVVACVDGNLDAAAAVLGKNNVGVCWEQQQQEQQFQQQQQWDTVEQDIVAGGCSGDEDYDWQGTEQQQQQPEQQQHCDIQQQELLHQGVSKSTQQASDAVQQLLGQLQLDANAMAILNGDRQLKALIAAALAPLQASPCEGQLQQGYQQLDSHQEQQHSEAGFDEGSGSLGSRGGSCNECQQILPLENYTACASDQAAVSTTGHAGQQHSRPQDGNGCKTSSRHTIEQFTMSSLQGLSDPAADSSAGSGWGTNAPDADLSSTNMVQASRDPTAVTSPMKSSVLHKLRSSMEGRHAVQTQQFKAGSAAAATTTPVTIAGPGSTCSVHSSSCAAMRPHSASHAAGGNMCSAAVGDSSAAASRPHSASVGSNCAACVGSKCATCVGSSSTAVVGRSSMSAEKLGTILAYLDAVDAEAEEEAAAAALGMGVPQQLMPSREVSQNVLLAPGSVAGGSTSMSRHPSRPGSRVGTAAALVGYGTSGQQVAGAATAGWRAAPTPEASAGCNTLAPTLQSSQAGVTSRPATAGRPQRQTACPAGVHCQQQQQLPAGRSAADVHGPLVSGTLLAEPSAAVSVGCYSMVPQGNRSAVLAESVFDGVRAKLSQLKEQLAEKEKAVAALQQELLDTRQHHSDQVVQLSQVHDKELAAAASDSAATVSRHLAFIDRLMEDKQQLNRQLAEQQAALKAAEGKHVAAIAALKAGWAAELRKQQAMWEAGAASKQEAWRAAKVAEIKEQTVKGLETEVQRLISRHRAELAATLEKAGEQTKATVEAAKVQHGAAMDALKARLRQEHEDALERERAAAAGRLREASERYEAQMQAARLRLIADSEVGGAAAAAKEEKRRAEVALEEAAAAARQHEAHLRQEWAREKEAVERLHARALEAAKAAAQEERSAWRAAVTEKIKRQAAEREDQLRSLLIAERDSELQEVITRLQEEQAATLGATSLKIAAENATKVANLEAQLKEAQRAIARLGDKARSAGQAATVAEQQRDELAAQLDNLRHEVQLRNQQLAAARSVVSATEAEGRAAAAAAGAAAATALTELAADKAQLEARVSAVQQQLQQAQQQHEAEMMHVERRVKGVIAKKDEAIIRLQQQLSAAVEQMRSTEAVLAAQQADLCD